jgi:membrane associated rhomboid family serine protease
MFPIRDDLHPTRVPVVTWALLLLNGAVFLWQLGMPEWALERFYLLYGIVPARVMNPEWAWYQGFPAGGLLTLVTSMFIHGGWLHILANLWTLWLFGDDVEDRLGSWRFLGLYLAAGLAAGGLQTVLFADSTIPTIGASGAVAGVMGAFLLLFPRARIEVLVPIFFFIDLWRVPAILYLPFWFVGELFSGTLALAVPNFANVAFWAHIGGFLAGMALVTQLVGNAATETGPARVRRATPDAIYGPGWVIIPQR